MNRWRILAVGALITSLMLVGGCSTPAEPAEEPAPAAAEAPDLSGTSWNCYEFGVSGEPVPVLTSAPITAEFSADGKLTGSAGVNTYSTTYKTDGSSIDIGDQIITTKMAGPDDAMRQETDFLTTLPTATTYNVRDGKLVLLGPAQNMVARMDPAE